MEKSRGSQNQNLTEATISVILEPVGRRTEKKGFRKVKIF